MSRLLLMTFFVKYFTIEVYPINLLRFNYEQLNPYMVCNLYSVTLRKYVTPIIDLFCNPLKILNFFYES